MLIVIFQCFDISLLEDVFHDCNVLFRYIRHEADRSSRSVMEVGNVTKGTEITFEYGTRRMGSKHDATKGKDSYNIQ